jgi:SAM-dependent methyltransferase
MMSISTHVEAGREADVYPLASCPCCGKDGCRTFYRAPSIPVHSCILLNTAEQARTFRRRDLELAYCDECGFVFNHIFDEAAMAYSTNFEESQHFSSTFNVFANELAREIAQRCAVSGKHVIEIGCGKGEFLRELCRVGRATGLGIDPGYREDDGRITGSDGVRFVADAFGPEYKHLQADVILCRHTLEHIAPVAEFVRLIREMSGRREATWIVFETPDAERVLADGAFWDIYYEHCSYFSPGTHARLFRQEGFDVTDLALVYGDQYILQYAKPTSRPTVPRFRIEKDLARMQALVEGFPDRIKGIQEAWRARMRSLWADGQRIALWGGGSKGVAFLTTLQLQEEVSTVVDINPYKQGKFLPGTGHPVISPSALVDEPPDLILVMNPIYLTEIACIIKGLGLESKIVAVTAELY